MLYWSSAAAPPLQYCGGMTPERNRMLNTRPVHNNRHSRMQKELWCREQLCHNGQGRCRQIVLAHACTGFSGASVREAGIEFLLCVAFLMSRHTESHEMISSAKHSGVHSTVRALSRHSPHGRTACAPQEHGARDSLTDNGWRCPSAPHFTIRSVPGNRKCSGSNQIFTFPWHTKFFFFVQTKMSWRRLPTVQHSR